MGWMVWGSNAGHVETFWYTSRSTPKPTQTCAQRVPGLSWGKGAGGGVDHHSPSSVWGIDE